MDACRIIPFSRYYCPGCGRPMSLVTTVPRFGSFPELRTFECQICGVTYTEAAKPDDKSTPPADRT